MHIFPEPPDGWLPEEKMFLKDMVLSVYKSIDDPTDKFILLASFESNYTQNDIAFILGCSQVAIQHRLAKTLECIRDKRKENEL